MQRQYDNGQNYKHQYRKHRYAYPMAFTLSNYYYLFLHIFYLLISIRQILIFLTVRPIGIGLIHIYSEQQVHRHRFQKTPQY